MITGIVLVVLYIYSGITPMTFYTATIFQDTGSNLSPNMSAIVIGVIQLIGTCVATDLVERVGRKVSLAIDSFMMTRAEENMYEKFENIYFYSR